MYQLQQNLDRYLNDKAFLNLLGEHGICIPSDFVDNEEGISAFWEKFHGNSVPRIMICGINPGRFGAGKTGIPFMDFASLSQLIPGVERRDSENSASFFFEVVKSFGAKSFFKTFYVTNFSSVGFVKDGVNFNYHDLPQAALETVERNFLAEIAIVDPTHVISLGREVHRSVRKLLPRDIDCSLYLPHPSWIATYRSSDRDHWAQHYKEALAKFVVES